MTYIFLDPRILSGCNLGTHRNFFSVCTELSMLTQNNPVSGLWKQCRKYELDFCEATKSKFTESQDHPV